MTDTKQVDDIPLRIEGVDDSKISDSQTVTIVALQPMVRKLFQPQSHLVNLHFDASADMRRQFGKSGIKRGVTDL
ncbi:MAG TPA: hypothetical protein PKA41_16155 [Verrucomicrobiota bacterium]|nr:hypothetical protein [Verrucomicrobiota bacterium]